jgi:peptidoglycan/xylan/chitin deacetylase (PgdA/CDA1 family)
MFHHFHDEIKHKKGQGSITNESLFKIIKFIGRKNILNADIFFEKLKEKKLKKTDVCFTFDDGLKSQFDIALPVLEEMKIKSFFFVYTSLFEKKPDNLEIFRYFRMNYFEKVNDFYKIFYEVTGKNLKNFFYKNQKKIKSQKIKFPEYSIEDIKFRIIRDEFLNKYEYEKIMFTLMKEKKFHYKNLYPSLFFNVKNLRQLNNLGHLIGLHSHTHPTVMEKLPYDDQKNEYKKCLNKISLLLNKPKNQIKYMSHPCGSYNNYTLEILKNLGIELGFKQIMNIEPERKMKTINNSFLEIARQDHSGILNKMNR